ncbi:MAG: aldehyde dehydrogenase family protein, partial [Acidimicrobiales bacterium]
MVERLIVAGERRLAETGERTAVVDPATGETVAEVAQAGPAEVEASLVAAHRVFEQRGAWDNPTVRGRVLQRVAQAVWDRSEDLARLEVADAGHPIADARWEADAAARTFEYYAGAANKHMGAVVPVQEPGLDVVLREPVGV